MSHFSVLVVTDGPATDEALAKALQPFHEFEATGSDDEFVQDVDVTADRLAEFEAATTRRFRDSDGALHDPYDSMFYREWTTDEINSAGRGGVPPMGSGTSGGFIFHSQDWGDGRGYRSKVHFVPEGEDVQVTTSEIMSFAAHLDESHGIKSVPFGLEPDLSGEHKHGYALIGSDGAVEKVVERTNPNAKWDWWCVGGRYGGRLAAGYDPEKDPANLETCWLCGGTGTRTDETAIKHHGGPMKCDNCGGTGKSVKWPPKQRDHGNRSRVGDLHFAAMKAANVAERRARIDEIRTKMNRNRRLIFGMSPMEDLEAAVAAYRSAKSAWSAMEEPRPRGDAFVDWLTQTAGYDAVAYYRSETWEHFADELADGQTVAEYIEAAPALTAYAVLKDGEWFERGEMGWFGMASNEMALDEWGAKVEELLAGLRPDQWVSIVDCHI